MSMREDTIAVMRAHPGRPASEVIPLVARRTGRSLSYAGGMYNWAVAQGEAPGELRNRRRVYRFKYTTPRDYADARRLLREALTSDPAAPDAVKQLMRDCSNYDAVGDAANGRTVNSGTLKRHNTLVSMRARALMSRCGSFKEWDEQTWNEHSTPVNVMGKWIEQKPRTDEEIVTYFRDNPVCARFSRRKTNCSRIVATIQREQRKFGIEPPGSRSSGWNRGPCRMKWSAEGPASPASRRQKPTVISGGRIVVFSFRAPKTMSRSSVVLEQIVSALKG